ncbi:long-chain acyl-CoA synthetase [Saccharomonospora amisosensis]|uniref:Acyl-CoA synthetase n=1 Tax=Saccharomonospora amisosensis TaxID=1128677 RepID=A0A7X5UQI0_9PSEU|nr:AMP-dependent synthetase/ligase [Saccharomonospora amisosensis]NIJ11893.1 long-chain acyl-CoA synthetase [Saccharomonospora amisosensis]
MHEFSVAPLVEVGDSETLTDAVYARSLSEPDTTVLAVRERDGWRDVGYGELAGTVLAVARGLLAEGVRAGDRVVVLGPTSLDWVVADLAVLSVGAVTVPVYPTASAEQVRAVLADAEPVACFADPNALPRLDDALGTELVWRLGESFAELASSGEAVCADEVGNRRARVRADDAATIVYTSGTTGEPKGCVLTHRNILAASGNVVALLPELFGWRGRQPTTLLFLPLAHVYGRVVLYGCLGAATRTGLVGNAADLVSELPAFRPTFLVGVPYVLEKIRKAVPDESAVPALLGGRLTHMICGGASLDASTLRFFTRAGLTVLGAYGLTETASTATMSAPTANLPGAAGRPVPGTTIAIGDDGEILVRGPQVSPGYWPDHGTGQEWVPTGDLGVLQDGYLRITGRRKEIIVTSGGKNVAPSLLEDRLRLHPLVANCMVVGEGRPYVSALVTVDPVALRNWAGTAEVDPADPRLLAEIATAVDEANALVSRAESIRRFRVVAGDFTVERGQLTPSLRLRRMVIEKDFAAEIEQLYAS